MSDEPYEIGDVVSSDERLYVVAQIKHPNGDRVAYAKELFSSYPGRCVCKQCHSDTRKVGHIEGFHNESDNQT